MKKKSKAAKHQKDIMKTSGAVAVGAVGAAGIAGIVALVSKCKKKKVYEDSMNDIKSSDEIL